MAVMIGPSQKFRMRSKVTPYDGGRMNAQEGEKQRQFGEQTCDPLDKIMLSPSVSKVNPSHLVDFAAHRGW